MAEESKRITVLIFLLFIFIFLAVIIFVFIYTNYRSTTNYSAVTTKASFECTAYSFRIEGGSLSYGNGTLSFVFDPTLGGATVKNALVIAYDDQEIETQPVDFTFKYQMRVQTPPLTAFQIYPKGCMNITRNCDLVRNQCE